MFSQVWTLLYVCGVCYVDIWTISVPQNLRLGVFDVVPANSLDGLTSEDLRLLLNGVGDINVQTLISYTSFNDESGEDIVKIILIILLWFL